MGLERGYTRVSKGELWAIIILALGIDVLSLPPEEHVRS